MRIPALILLSLLLAAGDPGPFLVIDFGPQGRITRTDFVDLNDDGRCEILRFDGRRLRLYALNDVGRYDPARPVEIDLPAQALFFDIGQVDDDPPPLVLPSELPPWLNIPGLPGADPPELPPGMPPGFISVIECDRQAHEAYERGKREESAKVLKTAAVSAAVSVVVGAAVGYFLRRK